MLVLFKLIEYNKVDFLTVYKINLFRNNEAISGPVSFDLLLKLKSNLNVLWLKFILEIICFGTHASTCTKYPPAWWTYCDNAGRDVVEIDNDDEMWTYDWSVENWPRRCPLRCGVLCVVQLEECRVEIQRRDQEILAMSAKMKTLEEQHQDYQRHIAVLKESLCAKEEHYNMLQADVEELRQRLEEKNRHIEKKQQQAQQERARSAAECAELREHMDIKDRKINVLQRKVRLIIHFS